MIALDYAPHGDVADDPIFNPSGELADAFARHRPLLPDGGSIAEESSRFFSPYFLWSRLPLSEENEEIISSHVFEAFEDYLRIYLAHVSAAQLATKRRADSLDSQLSYSTYRAENDSARPMLTRLYGEGFAERLISEVLFDLPLRMMSHDGSFRHSIAMADACANLTSLGSSIDIVWRERCRHAVVPIRSAC